MTIRPMPASFRWSFLLFLPVLTAFPLGCNSDKATRPPSGDRTAPAAIQDLAVTNPPGRHVNLTWTAPGDDGMEGQAARYEIRCATSPITEATWDSATVVGAAPVRKPPGRLEGFYISDLPFDVWHIAVKTADEVPNWSALSNVVTATVADLIPPGAVTNLVVSSTTATSALLTWSAPGNDGSEGQAAEYDLRYALSEITEETWEEATRVPGVPAPKDAGQLEAFRVTGLENEQIYFFGLKTGDESGNWSALSSVASAAIVDYIPPDRVTNLVVWATAYRSLVLAWTAPGNDGPLGRAVEYDLRYSVSEINEGTWESAMRVPGVPPPDSAGTPQGFSVIGLDPGLTYYLALKTADEEPNWSALSNVASGTVSTTAMRRLTYSPGGHGVGAPSWSPDGASILFSANWTELYYKQIYKVPASGGEPIQLTDPEGEDFDPSWSPDGTRLVFVSDRTSPNPTQLWVMNAAPWAPATLLIQEDQNLSSCRWSPDGSRIAYRKYTVFPSWQSAIRIVPAAGGTPQSFTDGSTFCYSPAWSPDGSKVAFTQQLPGEEEDIWVKPVGGGEAIRLTTDPEWDVSPSWSPDGSRIVFSSGRGGDADLWIMSASGGNATPLTAGLPGEGSPVWSPDGRQIAFLISEMVGGAYRTDIWILELE